jgi:hypothetical protein
MTEPIDSLKTIARYIEAKKPKTLAEAEHMLDLISVIADETVGETEAEPSLGLSAEPLAKFDERMAALAEGRGENLGLPQTFGTGNPRRSGGPFLMLTPCDGALRVSSQTAPALDQRPRAMTC